MIEILKQMVEALQTRICSCCYESEICCAPAIKNAIQAGRKAITELESQYPHGMYGAEDLDKAWKSGYDNCKDQYAYLDKQEPVAWMREDATLRFTDGKMFAVGQPFYTHPPQRTWVGLTDEEVESYWDWEDFQTGAGCLTILKMVRDIEAKIKEKNF